MCLTLRRVCVLLKDNACPPATVIVACGSEFNVADSVYLCISDPYPWPKSDLCGLKTETQPLGLLLYLQLKLGCYAAPHQPTGHAAGNYGSDSSCKNLKYSQAYMCLSCLGEVEVIRALGECRDGELS